MNKTQPTALGPFLCYTPEVERRGHISIDSPGLIRLKSRVKELVNVHDQEFIEPRTGYHNALLADHLENVELYSEVIAHLLGCGREEIYKISLIGYLHDFSKTVWHGHRIEGPLPESERAAKEGHAKLSKVMLIQLGSSMGLTEAEWKTLRSVCFGVRYHHTPERLAQISHRVHAVRELKLASIVHFVDIYVGMREYRGPSHPGVSHADAITSIEARFRKSKYGYLSQVAPPMIEALNQPLVEGLELQIRG
ncbi:MAG: hypothetical protein JWO40_98 [Candidatus Doudnabacteria bacterium]|nr:hypothetical protein [Candidatus Doudnabacteria bacterium]